MKKSFMILSALLVVLVVPVLTGSVAAAQTAQISFISVGGNWHDPVDNIPGNQPGQPAITNGVPTSSINWGVTSGSQSGYDFARKIPGTLTLPPAPTPFFPLGTFTHRNFPIDDPSLTSVQLDVVLLLNVDGVQTGPLKFTFTFNHVETPNDPSPGTCPYPTPSGEGCTDRVTFVSAPKPTTFNVRGVDYTLSMSFVGSNGNPVAEFITREGRVNTADLVGQFTLPPTTAAPVLTVRKSGPATMNVGQWGNFAIDVQNTGASDAWNASIRDLFPKAATGGMCDLTPEILSARVYAADGVTPVAGKGPLNSGSDYSVIYNAANCRLDITMLTAAGRISRNERLIIRYRTQIDNNTQNGVVLTNVAGAIQWFNADSTTPSRTASTRTLTNGTPGVLDHEDAHSVTVALTGYFFEKTVANLTSGANPAVTAAPGDRLRYTLRFRSSQALNNFRILDELDALNAQAAFAPGTFALVTSPTGADVSGSSSTGGSKGTGVIDIRNLSVTIDGDAVILFDITLKSAIANGTVVSNQSTLRLANGTVFAMSDDPTVNGAASSTVSGDEDPTRVTIVAPSAPPAAPEPALVVTKSGPATMNLGQWGDFLVDVQNTGNSGAWNANIRDRLPDGPTGGMCDLTPEIQSVQVFASDGVTPIPGKGALNPGAGYLVNYSAAPNCQLEIMVLTGAGTIGPNERLIIRYRTKLDGNTQNSVSLTNVAGAIQWFDADSSNPNRKAFTRTLTNGTPGVVDHEDDHTVTVALAGYFFEKTVADLTSGASPAVTAAPGDKLRYTLRFRTTNQALSNFRISDELDALNAQAAFVPGTLTLVTFPSGADVSSTSNTAGAKGSGIVDIRSLNVPVNGDALIQFDITLAKTLSNGTVVSNQSTLRLSNDTVFALSDDPNVNGTANPNVPGDEDPTRLTIASASPFRVQKISTDLSADPNVLLANETLRYTITVKNISTADAANVVLRDAVPANTTYVANSTTLNDAAVADVAGASSLVNGMLINSPANSTPGSMPADASSSTANVATITFDVVVNQNVAGGTIISNQGFVSATANGIVDYPSDDPDTPTPNDPTIDIVGNSTGNSVEPALVVTKSGPATMNLGQWGDFVIDVQNPGINGAWNITVRDLLPKAATGGMCDLTPEILSVRVYAADGITPIAAKGLLNSGSDYSLNYTAAPNCQLEITLLTASGTIGPNERLIIRYRTQLDANTQNGVALTNVAGAIQWFNADSSNPNRRSSSRTLTNGTPGIVDHEDAHTVTTALGVVPNFRVQKISTDLTGDPNVLLVGETLRYTITVKNIGSVDAADVMLRDVAPVNTTYVSGSATLNGKAVADVAGASPLVTGMKINSPANSTSGFMPADASSNPANVAIITFDVAVSLNVAVGTVISNQGFVTAADSGIVDQPSDDPDTPILNDPTLDIVGSVTGPGIPGFGVLSGSAWHDADFNDARDSRERPLRGWTVELYRDNQLMQSASTDVNGDYRITDVAPNDQTGARYELRFRAPGAGANTATLGRAVSPFTNGQQRIINIVVTPGADLQDLNLPIHPNGVIYNSVQRTPVAGVTLNLLDVRSGSTLPSACFDDAAQQGQITLADGYYKFDINFSDPACPSGGDYLIDMTAPQGTNYVTGYSQIIPPASSASTAAFSVPGCANGTADAIPGTAQYCEVQPSEFPPAASIPARSAGTSYYVHLMLDSRQMPGTSQIFNNHIALDPLITGSLSISKTTPLLNVTRGQLVPYVITVKNPAGMMLTDVSIVDRLPLGFSYVAGSALLDGVPTEPAVSIGTLSWNSLVIAGTETRTLRLLVAVGAGVSEGEFVNRAQVMNGLTGASVSSEATATVRLIPDLTFDCTDVTGKVFNDANRNGLQDNGEQGLPGVRVVTPRGLQAITDKFGRYHISCAITPNESRGSNFVLKLDDRTLPSGFRISTDPLQIKRATRGKTLQLNFAGSIHRVVGIDLSDAVFEPGKIETRVQWRPHLDLLLQELTKGPAVLRLSYVADTEDAALVQRRLEAIKRQLTEAWSAANYNYSLTIEPEVFWRRGAPLKRPDVPKKR